MHHTALGSVCERSANLDENLMNLFGGKVVTLAQTIGERATFHVLHHEENRVTRTPNAMDWDNVRVLERSRDARFALESLDEGGVERERSWENLNRDVAIEGALASAKDDRHSAASELFENVVFVRERRPNKFRIVGL
jgi:hypothetical protein